MSIAIRIENLSKQYRLGLVGTGTLSHDLKRWWIMNIMGKEDPYLKIGEVNDRATKGESDYVWALKNINLDIEHGEVLGIIGKNGAGKSTLLKLLSRVTKPSTGNIYYNGRIASLLEVGTGFHPEMTGRENIYMNGSIMGMNKKEINRKLDQIIDFAGIERYIDTPVKRYSSGMTVRLGFSIAAHLEPDILVVDEVLAVGDAEFQKKAIGKMQDVSKGQGRTVLFVSHNMGAVSTLCNNAIVLDNGQLKFLGTAKEGISYYMTNRTKVANYETYDNVFFKGIFELKSIKTYNKGLSVNEPVADDEIIYLDSEINITSNEPKRYHLTFHLLNEMGDTMFSFGSGQVFFKGLNIIRVEIPKGFFQAGSFSLNLLFVEDSKRVILHIKDVFSFNIVDGKKEIGAYMEREPGYIRPKFKCQNITI